jgi:hypothetical protein
MILAWCTVIYGHCQCPPGLRCNEALDVGVVMTMAVATAVEVKMHQICGTPMLLAMVWRMESAGREWNLLVVND